MDKKMYYILGTIFIITSGLIYTFERFISQYPLSGHGTGSINQDGSASSYTMILPSSPFSNIFVSIFIVISVIFYVRGYTKK